MTHQYHFFAKPPATILAEAIAEHSPTHIFAMYSGGHDSACAVDLAHMHCNVTATVHINTGIGIEATRIHARKVAKERGWNLIEMHPPDMTYRGICAKFGFPGPGYHALPYSFLKERCIRQLVREHKKSRTDRIMLVTGARYQESERRMGNAVEVNRVGATVWVAPILYWSHDDKWKHMRERGIPENDVVRLLHMSGECLCGAFAHPGELDEIRFWYPEAAAEIDACAEIARQNGRHDKWGERPPEPPKDYEKLGYMPLCFSCLEREDAA